MVTKCHKGKVLPIPGNEAPAMIRHPAREYFHRGEPAAHAEQRIFPLYHWFQCKLAPGRCATPRVCEWPRRRRRPGIPEEIHRSPMCNTLHFMSIACYIGTKVNDHDPRGKLLWRIVPGGHYADAFGKRPGTTTACSTSARRWQANRSPGCRSPGRLELCLMALGRCSLPLRPQNHCSRATQTRQQ
jgi:hypothetical protein